MSEDVSRQVAPELETKHKYVALSLLIAAVIVCGTLLAWLKDDFFGAFYGPRQRRNEVILCIEAWGLLLAVAIYLFVAAARIWRRPDQVGVCLAYSGRVLIALLFMGVS